MPNFRLFHSQRCLATGLLAAGAWHCAWAAHPLQTDDTGTQGQGHWQLEVNTDRVRSRNEGVKDIEQQINTTWTYGLRDDLDAAITQPYLWQKPGAGVHRSDPGDTSLGLKWRMYDNQAGWTLALRPTLTLPVATSSRGFGTGRTTGNLALLSSYQQGDWYWLANAGYTYNDNKAGDRKNLWAASAAALYNIATAWTLAAELSLGRNPATTGPGTMRNALLGAIYHLGENTDFDLGVRRNWQRRLSATTAGIGFTQRW